jgi:hypothetical protein
MNAPKTEEEPLQADKGKLSGRQNERFLFKGVVSEIIFLSIPHSSSLISLVVSRFAESVCSSASKSEWIVNNERLNSLIAARPLRREVFSERKLANDQRFQPAIGRCGELTTLRWAKVSKEHPKPCGCHWMARD